MGYGVESRFPSAVRVGAVALALFFAAPAFAGDPKDLNDKVVDETTAKVVELETVAKKHLADKADDALKADVAAAVKLAAETSDAKLRARIITVVGSILSGRTEDGTQRAAIKGIGEIGDSSAFRYLRPFLNQPTPKDNPPLLIDAIDAASKIHADDSVIVLMALVEKSDVMPVAVAAMKAFIPFAANKPTRVKIVSDLIQTVKKDRPGVTYRWSKDGGIMGADRTRTRNPLHSGEDSVTRYQALAGVMCETLNKMTGQNVAAPEDWFDMKDKYKSNLSILFPKG